MSTSEESERRLGEAMRAHATGVGRSGFAGRHPAPPGTDHAADLPARGARRPPAPTDLPAAAARARPAWWTGLVESRFALLVALLGGIVLGIALALLSLLAPGFLPPLG